MKKKNLLLLTLTIIMMLNLAACKNTPNLESFIPDNEPVIEIETSVPTVNTPEPSIDPSIYGDVNGITVPYIELNNNRPLFTEADIERAQTENFEIYSELDEYRRCQVAYANICQELMPTEERDEIGSVKPSGWCQAKYENVVQSNPAYLYNRCHLIGFQLAGENANTKNLITGTRYFNVEGMLPFENQIANYVHETNNHVLFRVTPIYNNNNLVANGVIMEAISLEDRGESIYFNVFVYNVQPGVYIDYATGESYLLENYQEILNNVYNNESDTDIPESTVTYVLNTNSKKIHEIDCESVANISEHNKFETNKSLSELKEEGYEPCGICKPN